MKSVITFTSTLSPRLMDWLNSYSEQEGVTKRYVIEAALKLLQSQEKKKGLAQMFTKLSQDDETLVLAEAGMGDFLEQLTANEK